MIWADIYAIQRRQGRSGADAIRIANCWQRGTKVQKDGTWYGWCAGCGRLFDGLKRARYCSVACAMPDEG